MKKRLEIGVIVFVLVLAGFFFFGSDLKFIGNVSIDLLDPSENNINYSTIPLSINFSANVTGNSSSEIVNISLLIDGVINETLDSNIWDDLSGTDEEGFLSEIRDIHVSPLDGLVYLGIFSGKFGVYNRTSNITENLSATDSGDWMGGSHVESVSVSPIDGLVYTGASGSKFGVYNRTSNVWEDLRGTDTGDWMAGSFTVNTISISPIDGLVYLGLPSGNFGVYNRTSNVTEDLSATDPGDWVTSGPYSIWGISVSPINGLVYTAISSGKFGVYNRTSNVWENLGTTDTGNWISVSHVNDVSVSPLDGLAYIVAASGKLGAYNRTSNVTEDLSSTDEGGWVGTDNIVGVSVSPINGLVYTVGINGKFGVYNRTSNIWTDLRTTDPGNWATALFISTVSVSPINGLVYTGGQSVRFGEYRFSLPSDVYEFTNKTFSSEGDHNWTIQSWGTDGNLYEETKLFTIDSTSPSATFICTPNEVRVGQTITCICSGSDGAGLGISSTSIASYDSTTITITPTGIGDHSVSGCSVTDLAGNVGTAIATYSVPWGLGTSASSAATATITEGTPTLIKTHVVTQVIPGVETVLSGFAKTGVTEVSIEVNQETTNAKVKVSAYDSKPTEVSSSYPLKTYRYLQISTENLNENLEKAKVKFEVDKTWVTEQSLDKNDLAISKFNEQEEVWDELETSFDSEDDNFYYYTVELDSFSFFVVGEKKTIIEQIMEEIEESYDKAGETILGLIIWWTLVIIFLVAITLISVVIVSLIEKNKNLTQKQIPQNKGIISSY